MRTFKGGGDTWDIRIGRWGWTSEALGAAGVVDVDPAWLEGLLTRGCFWGERLSSRGGRFDWGDTRGSGTWEVSTVVSRRGNCGDGEGVCWTNVGMTVVGWASRKGVGECSEPWRKRGWSGWPLVEDWTLPGVVSTGAVGVVVLEGNTPSTVWREIEDGSPTDGWGTGRCDCKPSLERVAFVVLVFRDRRGGMLSVSIKDRYVGKEEWTWAFRRNPPSFSTYESALSRGSAKLKFDFDPLLYWEASEDLRHRMT